MAILSLVHTIKSYHPKKQLGQLHSLLESLYRTQREARADTSLMLRRLVTIVFLRESYNTLIKYFKHVSMFSSNKCYAI